MTTDGLNIAHFDDFLSALRESGRALRLLVVFIDTRRGSDTDDTWDDEVGVAMATDIPLTAELNFRQVFEKGRTLSWDYVLVGVLSSPDGSMPSAEEAETHLQGLCLVISGEGEGDLSGCSVFDREGNALPAGD